jgi:DNA mismatch endonuclease (patch repair protein)
VAIFCDGDFWHGKDWAARQRRLALGANREYWLKKIESNMDRDQQSTAALERLGWRVLRFWESEIRADIRRVLDEVAAALSDADTD